MKVIKEFDFMKFHTPLSESEKTEIYLVVDKYADDDSDRIQVMEIHQKLSLPCINTFKRSDLVLHYRPTTEEIEEIKKGKKVLSSLYK